jgi:hypothetical protein
MVTTFRISAAEFNDAIIEKIKMMFTSMRNNDGRLRTPQYKTCF